jgi:hypothetical protein
MARDGESNGKENVLFIKIPPYKFFYRKRRDKPGADKQ